MRDPAVRGQCGPLPRPAAFVVVATPCGRLTPPTSRPIAVVRMRPKEYRGFRALSTWRVRIRPRDADTPPRSSRGSSAKTGFVMGIRASAALTSPPDLIRRRAIAIATFSLPWKYLLAVSEDIAIFTRGSQSTSSVHSQWRLPPSPVAGGADVGDEVEVLELVAHRDVGVAQLGAHLRVLVHHGEDPVDDRPELAGGLERDAHRPQEPERGPAGADEDAAGGVVPPPEDERRCCGSCARRPACARSSSASGSSDEVEREDVEREREAAGFFAVVDARTRRRLRGGGARGRTWTRSAWRRPRGSWSTSSPSRCATRRACARPACGRRACGPRACARGRRRLGAVSRPTSSAETRLARPSTSVRRPLSSASTRSSSTSRILFAATAISPESCWAAPPVPANVRSTAVRTASTASTAPAALVPSCGPSCPSCPFSPWRTRS